MDNPFNIHLAKNKGLSGAFGGAFRTKPGRGIFYADASREVLDKRDTYARHVHETLRILQPDTAIDCDAWIVGEALEMSVSIPAPGSLAAVEARLAAVETELASIKRQLAEEGASAKVMHILDGLIGAFQKTSGDEMLEIDEAVLAAVFQESDSE